jgi:hypothetical protein
LRERPLSFMGEQGEVKDRTSGGYKAADLRTGDPQGLTSKRLL